MRLMIWASAALVWMGSQWIPASRADEDSRSVRSHAIYLTLRSQYQSRGDLETSWKFGRACFDYADFSSDRSQREKIAKEGIEACRHAISLDGNSAPAHYYLALNFGQLARTRSLGALRLVRHLDNELKTAAQLDPKLDYAGPDRTLGILYLQAPGWPTSVGSPSKAREHLERSVELSPNYPDNHLNLLEVYLKLKDREAAEREKKVLEGLWPKARKEFAGERWEGSWIDWQRHWDQLQRKMEHDENGEP